MIDETIVIDDIVDRNQQNEFYNLVLQGPWRFVKDMSYNESQNPSYGFNQLFKHPTHGTVSALYEVVAVPIINNVLEKKQEIKITDVVHCRAFLQLPLAEKFVKEHNGVHIDIPKPHIAAVYYLNDSDGDTVIYENNWENTVPGSTGNILIEHKRVSPKKGRIVLFNGFRYHCSTQPRNNHRLILNFNLV